MVITHPHPHSQSPPLHHLLPLPHPLLLVPKRPPGHLAPPLPSPKHQTPQPETAQEPTPHHPQRKTRRPRRHVVRVRVHGARDVERRREEHRGAGVGGRGVRVFGLEDGAREGEEAGEEDGEEGEGEEGEGEGAGEVGFEVCKGGLVRLDCIIVGDGECWE